MLKLPVGIQAFETIRRDGYLYVDKTEHIHRLINEGMFYFLSRPRRFGKSLFISTLKCLFQAKKELFAGLWIAEHGQLEWQEHPVILIDFNQVSHDTPDNLRLGLETTLKNTAETCDVALKSPLLKGQFQELVTLLYQKFARPVVILVDEYDKPIIDHLGKDEQALEIARANRDILKQFFGVLKGGDVAPLLRLVFITGVSRFSRVSLFSDLNNLEDITMNKRYASTFGYTQAELEHYFQAHVEQFAGETGETATGLVSKLARKYDGYRFSDRDICVYNPFSVLKALKYAEFGDYWFESGTPTFLVNLLRQRGYHLPEIENLQVDRYIFSTYDIDDLRPEAILFQTGYVTIKDVQDQVYTLSYPNQEVKKAFIKHLLYSFTGGKQSSHIVRLYTYLQQETFETFFETVAAIFAAIPYTLSSQKDEAYFHTLFYLMVSASGADVKTEVLTSRGRIDLVLEFADKVLLIEFKCNRSAKAGIKQIKDKGYAERYQQSGKKLFLIGVNFSTEKRNVVGWDVEEIAETGQLVGGAPE